jgi:hypothetical protein
MADGTSDDRACREPAKRPGYDRASILRRSRGRAAEESAQSDFPLSLQGFRTLTPLILVRIQVLQPQNLSIPLRIFDFYGLRNSPDTSAR